MMLSYVAELSLITVLERGIPNRECVALKARQPTQMGQFGLMVGWAQPGGSAIPLKDHLFWFGDAFVAANDWVMIYTAVGTPRVHDWQGAKVYSLHWGRPTTLFANPAVVPILFRMDAIETQKPPVDQPQVGQLQNRRLLIEQ